MKKKLLVIVLMLLSAITFAQELIIVVAPFDVRAGSGFSKSDAETIEYLLLNELSKSKTIKVLDQSDAMFREIVKRMEFELSDWSNPKKVADFGRAINANAILLGRMMTLGNEIIIAVRINDLSTEIKATNDMIVTSVGEVRGKLPAFTKEIVNNLPKPPIGNPFIGRWRSTITSNEKTLICILHFKSDGTVNVERYDTNKVTRSLAGMSHSNETKRGRGSGSYSFRESGNSVVADISLTLSGVSSEFTAVTARVDFNINSPNQFEVYSEEKENSMKCEYFIGGKNERYISDTYEIFYKL